MNNMISHEARPSFIFRVLRPTSQADFGQLVSCIKLRLDNVKLLQEYPLSERTFDTALATSAVLEVEKIPTNFERGARQAITKLGFNFPDPAEVLSFVYYNVPRYEQLLPQFLVCGVRRESPTKPEIILFLKREARDFGSSFSFIEVSAKNIGVKSEILLIREHEEEE